MNRIDTIIRGGRIIDTAAGTDAIQDIGIDNGLVVPLEPGSIATQNIDADGCLVLPGLIDFHVHTFGDGSGWGIAEPDLLLATGVTAAVDAGSAGCVNYRAMRCTMTLSSMVKMKIMLNVYSGGTLDITFDEILDPDKFNVKQMRRIIQDYRDEIIALKIRIPKSITRSYGLKPFHRAVDLARDFGLPLCVHITDPDCTQADIAARLTAGDIMCHIFHGRGETILGADGKIRKEIWNAHERGVVFDVAHGNTNFTFSVICQALSEGLLPDVLSTDLCRDKLNISTKTKSLAQVMSLYLDLGMDLADVVRAVTQTPAHLMGMEGRIGTLRPGACGDVSILKIEDRRYLLTDYANQEYLANRMFIPKMTIADGEIAFCQQDFNLLTK